MSQPITTHRHTSRSGVELWTMHGGQREQGGHDVARSDAAQSGEGQGDDATRSDAARGAELRTTRRGATRREPTHEKRGDVARSDAARGDVVLRTTHEGGGGRRDSFRGIRNRIRSGGWLWGDGGGGVTEAHLIKFYEIFWGYSPTFCVLITQSPSTGCLRGQFLLQCAITYATKP